MPESEALDFHGLSSALEKVRYAIRFIWLFVLDQVAFFCVIKNWRTVIHRWRCAYIGKGVHIGRKAMFDRVFSDQILIDDHTSIGDRTTMTAQVNIPSKTPLKKLYSRAVMQTRIGSGAWIMPNIVVASGSTIENEALVATEPVVTKDVPPKCLLGAAPAKVLKDLSNEETFKG